MMTYEGMLSKLAEIFQHAERALMERATAAWTLDGEGGALRGRADDGGEGHPWSSSPRPGASRQCRGEKLWWPVLTPQIAQLHSDTSCRPPPAMLFVQPPANYSQAQSVYYLPRGFLAGGSGVRFRAVSSVVRINARSTIYILKPKCV